MKNGYDKYMEMENKYKSMTPEEKIRWHLANDCTCGVHEGWWIPYNHFNGCPLENPDCENWIFFEGVLEGFVYP